MMAAIAGLGGFNLIPFKKQSEPKNKYNLTEAEIEALKSMSPKQKKKFLKERR